MIEVHLPVFSSRSLKVSAWHSTYGTLSHPRALVVGRVRRVAELLFAHLGTLHVLYAVNMGAAHAGSHVLLTVVAGTPSRAVQVSTSPTCCVVAPSSSCCVVPAGDGVIQACCNLQCGRTEMKWQGVIGDGQCAMAIPWGVDADAGTCTVTMLMLWQVLGQ